MEIFLLYINVALIDFPFFSLPPLLFSAFFFFPSFFTWPLTHTYLTNSGTKIIKFK